MCFLHRCEEYFLCQYIPPEGIHSVGEHINLEIAIYLERIEDSRQRRIRQLIFQCLLKRETCISGCDSMNEIDLLELGSYTELQGGNIVLPSGYSSILSPVAQDIPQNSVLLNHPVTEIRWQRDSYNSNNTNRRNKKYITVDDRSSPFAIRDIYSRSAQLGFAHGKPVFKYWMKKNPNEAKKTNRKRK